MKACVFCSSSENLAHEYYETGFTVCKLLAKHWHSLVFGGYSKGIMGAVAGGVQENGGKVVSVIPAVFNNVRPNFEDDAEDTTAGYRIKERKHNAEHRMSSVKLKRIPCHGQDRFIN